jgi:hypothetical protein
MSDHPVTAAREHPPQDEHTIDGSKLLDDLAQYIGHWIELRPEWLALVTLWSVATYFKDMANVRPMLPVSTSGPNCGKSHLLDVLAAIASRALIEDGSQSTAGMARTLANGEYDSLLVDEASDFMQRAESARFINALYNPNRAFTRCDPKTYNPVHMWPSGFLLTAGVNLSVHRHTPTKCYVVPLLITRTRRELPHWDLAKVQEAGEPLKLRTQEWCDVNRDSVRDAIEPAYRNAKQWCESDRHCQNWEIVLAIADIAGGSWPERAMNACRIAHDKLAPTMESCFLTDLEAALQDDTVQNEVTRYSGYVRGDTLCDAFKQLPNEVWEALDVTRLGNLFSNYDGVTSERQRTPDGRKRVYEYAAIQSMLRSEQEYDDDYGRQ